MSEIEVLLTILTMVSFLAVISFLAAIWIVVDHRRRLEALGDDLAKLDRDIGELWQVTFPSRETEPRSQYPVVLPFMKPRP